MLNAEKQYAFDRASALARKHGLGTELGKTKNVVRAKYSFASQGGVAGDIALVDADGVAVVIPDNAIITKVLVDVLTAPTSGGAATLALKSEGAADLLGATAVAAFTGFIDGVPANTAASVVKMTADRTLYLTVAVADLTAGVFDVFVEYVLSE